MVSDTSFAYNYIIDKDDWVVDDENGGYKTNINVEGLVLKDAPFLINLSDAGNAENVTGYNRITGMSLLNHSWSISNDLSIITIHSDSKQNFDIMIDIIIFLENKLTTENSYLNYFIADINEETQVETGIDEDDKEKAIIKMEMSYPFADIDSESEEGRSYIVF